MPKGILGRKVGITQRFGEGGEVIPLTVVQAGPCVVVQRKTKERDGYDAIQLGLVEPARKVRANKPREGHFKKAQVAPVRVLREFRLEPDEDVKVGESVKVSMFAPSELVNVSGVSKGKGFAGVIKRHHFGGGRASHGSMFHRAPGSIGQSSYPSRVMRGMRAPGHMGQERVTVKNLQVVEVSEEENLLLLRGAVPGANGSYVEIFKSSKKVKIKDSSASEATKK